MSNEGNECPRCGSMAAGKFCPECGTPIQSRPCPACQAALSPGSRFCHMCGSPLGRRSAGPSPSYWWIIGGVAAAAVVFVIGSRLTIAGTPSAPTATPPVASARPAPDISNLTPRQRADTLFDRIMVAYENGDSARATFFVPMGLEAYRLTGDLDIDARYHVGLIHAVAGNRDGVLAQADSLGRAEPDHLFIPMLHFAAEQLESNQPGIAAAYEDFLAHYDAQLATDRPEYRDHRAALDAFRSEARGALGTLNNP